MSQVTVFIARHGECSGNVEQTFLDPFTDVLTPTGEAQAKLLGKHLSDIPFTKAYSSDFPRARQTAEAVIAANTKANGVVTVNQDARLEERDFTGIFGMPAKDALINMHASMKSGTSFTKVEIENCETVAQFEERIISFFREFVETLKKNSAGTQETVLLVSHGLTIQRIFILLNTNPQILGVDEWENSRICERQMRNTTYHKILFEIGDRVKGRVEQAHCRGHMPEMVTGTNDNVKDEKNYSFLQQRDKLGFEEETVHYCTPV